MCGRQGCSTSQAQPKERKAWASTSCRGRQPGDVPSSVPLELRTGWWEAGVTRVMYTGFATTQPSSTDARRGEQQRVVPSTCRLNRLVPCTARLLAAAHSKHIPPPHMHPEPHLLVVVLAHEHRLHHAPAKLASVHGIASADGARRICEQEGGQADE